MKELVIIYDTPAMSHNQIMGIHNIASYLKYFDTLHILYWSKEDTPLLFQKKDGKLVFYPYKKKYNSGYITGLRYMTWIVKILLGICVRASKNTRLVFMPIMPLWPGLPSLLVGKVKRKKVIVRLEAHKMDYIKWEEGLEGKLRYITKFKLFILSFMYRFTLPFYNYVIGISKGLTQEAIKYGAKNAITLPIVIRMNNNSDKDAIFKQRSIYKYEILYVGQIKKIKGIHNLIEACNGLYKEDIKPKILIAGAPTNPKDEKYYQELKKLSKGLDIEFLGWVNHEELENIYIKSDILVLPSYTEALGLVIMEAMAQGLVIIASDVSGPKDLVENGKTGFLIKPGDVSALQEKIKILLQNKEKAEFMGVAGKAKIIDFIKEASDVNNKFWSNI